MRHNGLDCTIFLVRHTVFQFLETRSSADRYFQCRPRPYQSQQSGIGDQDRVERNSHIGTGIFDTVEHCKTDYNDGNEGNGQVQGYIEPALKAQEEIARSLRKIQTSCVSLEMILLPTKSTDSDQALYCLEEARVDSRFRLKL